LEEFAASEKHNFLLGDHSTFALSEGFQASYLLLLNPFILRVVVVAKWGCFSACNKVSFAENINAHRIKIHEGFPAEFISLKNRPIDIEFDCN
jgi:hypothetical protein